jgi:hypothetical protein
MTRNLSKDTLQRLASHYNAKPAIYYSDRTVTSVKLVDVAVQEDLLIIWCQPVPARGLNAAGQSWKISAHKDIISASETYVATSHLGWRIFLDPEVIAKVLGIAAKLPDGKTYADDSVTAPAPTNSRFIAIRTPSACAAELFRYLHEQQLNESSKPGSEVVDQPAIPEKKTKKEYQVCVADNYHYMEERYAVGSYDSLQEALEKCREIAIRSLEHFYETGITPEKLSAQWAMFGEDPFIVGGNGPAPFSARKFITTELCQQIIDSRKIQ